MRTGETKKRVPPSIFRIPSVIMRVGSGELEMGRGIPSGMLGAAAGVEKSEKGMMMVLGRVDWRFKRVRSDMGWKLWSGWEEV